MEIRILYWNGDHKRKRSGRNNRSFAKTRRPNSTIYPDIAQRRDQLYFRPLTKMSFLASVLLKRGRVIKTNWIFRDLFSSLLFSPLPCGACGGNNLQFLWNVYEAGGNVGIDFRNNTLKVSWTVMMLFAIKSQVNRQVTKLPVF